MATDPNRFYDQSWQTQQDFLYVYGGGSDWDAAAKAWVKENDRGGGDDDDDDDKKSSKSSSKSSGKSSSGSSNDDVQKMVDYYTALSQTPFYKDYAEAQRQAAGFERTKLDQQMKYYNRSLDITDANNRATIGIKKDELGQNQRQFEQTLGFNREKLAADIEQSKAQLELQRNELELEKGKAYADAWYKEQLVNLAIDEHQRLWYALGLDYTKAAIEYASTPDKIWQLADFNAAMRGMVQGNAPAFGGQALGMPTPNSLAGLYASWGIAPGTSPTAAGAAAAAAAPNPNHPVDPHSSNVDPRVNAAHAIIDANPPSGFEGWGPNELNALQGVANVLRQGGNKLPLGSLEGMRRDQRDVLGAGIARLGGNPSSFFGDYYNSRPGQGGSTAA